MKTIIRTLIVPLSVFFLVSCEGTEKSTKDTDDIVNAYVSQSSNPLYKGVSTSKGLSENEAGALQVVDNFYLALQKRDFEHLRNVISPYIDKGVDEVIAYYKDKITTNNIIVDRFKVMTIELGSSADASTEDNVTYTVEVTQTYNNQTTVYKDKVELRKKDNNWGIVSITTTVAESR